MRVIDLIVVHCSDSDIPAHDNIETIRKWHTARDFIGPDGVKGTHDDVGYNYFITKDGTIHPGRDEKSAGAHTKGYNSRSIGICLSGRDEFRDCQFSAFEKLVKDICKRYALEKKDILAHNELDPMKSCPNFDVQKLISSWEWH